MRKKTLDRMIKLVHEINDGPLSYPLIIKRLKPLDQQSNYNRLLQEWTEGEPEFEVVAEVNGIFSAFKESEKWHDNGTLSIHDFKCTINETDENGNPYVFDTNCIAVRKDTGEEFEIVFKREYIGESAYGFRPVVK